MCIMHYSSTKALTTQTFSSHRSEHSLEEVEAENGEVFSPPFHDGRSWAIIECRLRVVQTQGTIEF